MQFYLFLPHILSMQDMVPYMKPKEAEHLYEGKGKGDPEKDQPEKDSKKSGVGSGTSAQNTEPEKYDYRRHAG